MAASPPSRATIISSAARCAFLVAAVPLGRDTAAITRAAAALIGVIDATPTAWRERRRQP
jgi:hypothetical protein